MVSVPINSNRVGKPMPGQRGLQSDWDELARLYAQAVELLAGLDRLDLDHAGAHLSMAIEIMRQRHPSLSGRD
jgi:hypothetical protein